MMHSGRNLQIAMAATGQATIGPLVEAARAEGCGLVVADGLADLLALAESGQCDAVVVASDAPQDLPAAAVHELLSLVPDVAVIFLLPRGCEVSDCPAMLGVTSDQVWDLQEPSARLVEAIRREARWAMSSQPEYAVFCIDDDEEFLASLKRLLTPAMRATAGRFALDLDFYIDPVEALKAVRALDKPLAAVICDQVMPGMQGVDLLSQIKEISPATHRVLLTGYAGLESAVRAVNEQLLAKYLTKPIEEPVDFVNAVRHLVCEYHLQLRAASQRQRMMAQFEFIHAVTGAENLAKVLNATTGFLLRQLGVSWTALLLLEDGRFVPRAQAGAVPDLTAPACHDWLEEICARALHQRLPEAISAPGQRAFVGTAQRAVHSFVAMPLSTRQGPLGVVLAGADRPRQGLSRDDCLLLVFVADVAAVTIARFKDHQALEGYYVGTMASLMDVVEAKDRYTRGHTDRVMQLAGALGRAAGAGERVLKDIEYAAALHDLGKLAVPEGILRKPGRLQPGELAIIKEHPARAEAILRHLRFLDSARLIILSHHERYDGAGYPSGLTGEEIPLGARILAIVDSYDAMTSTRPYRRAMTPSEALAEIRAGAGSQFDPRLAAVFAEMMAGRAAEPLSEGVAARPGGPGARALPG